jgi:hypothetical protein
MKRPLVWLKVMYIFSTSFIPSNTEEFQCTIPNWPWVDNSYFYQKKSQTWSWILICSPFLLLIWDTLLLFSTVFQTSGIMIFLKYLCFVPCDDIEKVRLSLNLVQKVYINLFLPQTQTFTSRLLVKSDIILTANLQLIQTACHNFWHFHQFVAAVVGQPNWVSSEVSSLPSENH